MHCLFPRGADGVGLLCLFSEIPLVNGYPQDLRVDVLQLIEGEKGRKELEG